jgi:hypothetical protein
MGLCNFLEKILCDQAAADQCQLSREQVLLWEKSQSCRIYLAPLSVDGVSLAIPPSALTRQDNTNQCDSKFITML